MSPVQTTDTFAALRTHSYINLTTFRKDGTAVTTPVWFALENGKIYIVTALNTGKVKRIRNTGRVQVAPSTQSGQPLGPAVEGVGRVLPAEETAVAKDALDRKYGMLKAVLEFVINLRGIERAWLEIGPA